MGFESAKFTKRTKMKFTGKNVLITGASKGIGASIARVLAGFGLKVWINYRSKPELADTLQAQIVQNGGCICEFGLVVLGAVGLNFA